MKPMTLRLLPVGFDFYLLRTMQRFTLVSCGPSPTGGRRYTVKEGAKQTTWLHHSCQIKAVVKPRDHLRLHSLGCRILPVLDSCEQYDRPDQSCPH